MRNFGMLMVLIMDCLRGQIHLYSVYCTKCTAHLNLSLIMNMMIGDIENLVANVLLLCR